MDSIFSLIGSGVTGTIVILFAISLIIFIHEYGHYIIGRACGIHADVFSLGFGTPIFQRRAKNGTLWQIAIIPLGGYVKFRGDMNPASMNADASDVAGSFAAAPLWARAATVIAGPAFNFILSIILYTGLTFNQGVFENSLVIGKLFQTPVVSDLRVGDEIIAVEGQGVSTLLDLSQLVQDLPPSETVDYTVLRNGYEVAALGPHPLAPIVRSVNLQSAAIDADLRIGDVILQINGQGIHSFSQLQEKIAQTGTQQITLKIWRDGQVLTKPLTPRAVDFPNDDGSFSKRILIGISGGLFFEPPVSSEKIGLGAAIGAAIDQTFYIVTSSISGITSIARGDISVCNLSGPVTMAEATTQATSQGIAVYIAFIAFVSAAIGLVNLFPIPVLDGGHLMFFAYEFIAGRKPNPAVFQVLMTAGMVLVFGVMILALSTDIFC